MQTNRIRWRRVRRPLARASVLIVVALAAISIGGAYASDTFIAPPPPAGPEPSRWQPAASGDQSESDIEAQRSAYNEDYESIQAGGGAVAVNPEYEIGDELPLSELPTGLLGIGQYLPDVSGEYRSGEFFPYEDQAEPPMIDSFTVPDSDDVMYVGRVGVNFIPVTGIRSTVNVYDRATLRDLYLIEARNPSPTGGYPDALALEIAEHYSAGQWRPLIHVYWSGGGQDIQWYDNFVIQPGWHGLRLERNQSNGKWAAYVDNQLINSSIYWPTSPYNYYVRTTTELIYENALQTPHDPANHHGDIWLRMGDYSTWSRWTNYPWEPYKSEQMLALRVYDYTSVWNPYRYFQYQYWPDFYDWMMRRL